MRFVIHGGGRMAQQVAGAIASEGHALQAVVSPKRPAWLESGDHFGSLDEIVELPDALIDFTLPGGPVAAADWCRSRLVAMVSGTTGLEEADRLALKHAAELVPVLWAPNLARGPNLLMRTVHDAAVALGTDVAVRILEVHHTGKKDAPSGTALRLAQVVANAWQTPLDSIMDTFNDEAPVGQRGRIQCVSRREGDVIGVHEVMFDTGADTIAMSHAAANRAIYAVGSIEAAGWLTQQPAGLYTGADWLAG